MRSPAARGSARRGTNAQIRWFDADPTYVLHWVNAYEDGDEIVLDGFFQDDPQPAVSPDATYYERLSRFISLDGMQTHLHRWRLNLATGMVKEERLSDSITEFGMINGLHGGVHTGTRTRRLRSRAGSCSTDW